MSSGFRWAPARGPAVAARAMVATSQPAATLAGLDMLRRGGSAADAAIAAAAVCCVAEPMSTGIGGDAFAVVAHGDTTVGLDAAGPAPRAAERRPVHGKGPRSVTVPGSVAGWAALSDRFGRLGLDACLRPAADLADGGVAAGPHCSGYWRGTPHAPAELGPAPAVGEVYRMPELAATLRAIGRDGPDAFYRGRVAAAIAAASWVTEADLDAYRPAWVEPMRADYRGVTVLELPPPTQGVVALEALALLAAHDRPGWADQVRAVALALEDGFARVRDGADVTDLLSPGHLAARAAAVPRLRPEPSGGTVYLCAVDADGMAVSFIQSLFDSFGSGVVAPGTGVVLNNRVEGFAVAGEVTPGRRPYHTLMPGMLLEGGRVRGPFGIMGGFVQAQAHVQHVTAVLDEGLDPQAALDRPRFRIEENAVWLEEPLWPRAGELRALGLDVREEPSRVPFGGGQAIEIRDGRLLGGSDPRKDGFAAGF